MYSIQFVYAKFLKKFLNLPAVRDSYIHKTSKICAGSNILDSDVERFTYIGNYCQVYNATIGKFCSIGDYCYIGGAEHPIQWVATSPVFHSGKNILNKNFSENKLDEHKKTIIGSDVWIGSMCLIKAGVRIGSGSIIGMGSIVTKDVVPYSIVAGNPARLIKKRFSDDIIRKLEEIKWWDFTDKELEEVSPFINEIGKFINEAEKISNIKEGKPYVQK